MKSNFLLSIKQLAIISLIMLFGLSGFTQEKWNYISPLPGSKFINPENTIVFRQGEELDLTSVKSSLISVSGSLSGTITGFFKLSKDTKTLIFYPDFPFKYKERITVNLNKGLRTTNGIEMEGINFSFNIMEADNLSLLREFYLQEDKREMSEIKTDKTAQKYQSNHNSNLKNTSTYPDDFPIPQITEFNNPAPGYIFYSAEYSSIDSYYLMVLDNYCTPVFFRKWPMVARDFRRTVNDRIIYCQRDKNVPEVCEYYITDKWYNILDTLRMGNGYFVDTHDALYFEDGSYLMMAYDPQPYAMDTVVPGGDPNATVTGFIVQELDADDNVVFQWRSWDHFKITDAVGVDLTAATIDYVHGNAFDKGSDGNIIFSCRHMDEITKIDRNTGDIIWRFGVNSLNNMFTYTNDTIGFSHQHDCRWISNGNLTLYDNGNLHDPHFSQSVEYSLDEVNLSATLVWNYINDPVVYGRAQGSTDRLPDGSSIICWGRSDPIHLTEATYAKTKALEIRFPSGLKQYRVYKFEWITDLFEPSVDTVDFGEYTGYTPYPFIIVLTNNDTKDLTITSTVNHNSSYYVTTPLPLTIPANGTANMTVNFFPTQEGQINDILTINSETMFADTLPQLIARQVYLMGHVEDITPPTAEIIPIDGTTNVPQDTILYINFNEAIEKVGGGVITNADLADLIIFKEDTPGGNAVAHTASIDLWKKNIIIIPDTLFPDQNYFLEFKGNVVQDGDGNVMVDSAYSHFTTGQDFGIDDQLLETISIYPNPTNNKVYIQLGNILPEFIKVLNITGHTIMEIQKPSEKTLEIDLQNQPAGIYFIEVYSNEHTNSGIFKIIKQ